MEWRSDYHIHVTRNKDNQKLEVNTTAPWSAFAQYGIYNHFNATIAKVKGEDNKDLQVVRIVPRYLFGITFDLMEELYGTDVSKFPIVGVFTQSTTYDRVIIQIYMNIVTLSVVFLLYANNPPHTLRNKNKKTEWENVMWHNFISAWIF